MFHICNCHRCVKKKNQQQKKRNKRESCRQLALIKTKLQHDSDEDKHPFSSKREALQSLNTVQVKELGSPFILAYIALCSGSVKTRSTTHEAWNYDKTQEFIPLLLQR